MVGNAVKNCLMIMSQPASKFNLVRFAACEQLRLTEFQLPNSLGVGNTQEGDILDRLFSGRSWPECPWYIVDLDPELVSFVHNDYLVQFLAGYVASGGSALETYYRFSLREQSSHGLTTQLQQSDYAAILTELVASLKDL